MTPRRRTGSIDRQGGLLLALLVVAICTLDVLPFVRLLGAALAPEGIFAPDAALTEIGSRSARAALRHTLETATLSTLVAVGLGGAVALALGLTDLRGRRPIGFLFVLSMLIAPQVTALAFLTLAGPSSPLLGALGLSPPPGSPNPMLGPFGIVTVLGLHHAPLVTVTLLAGLKRIPHHLAEAAQVEGAGPGLIVGRIVLPLLRPHLVGATLLAFVAGVGNFGIPALLGMPANYLTLPTLIYRRLTSLGPSVIGDAAALSVLTAAIAGAGVLAAAFALRKPATSLEEDRPIGVVWHPRRPRPVEAALWAVVGIVLVLPLLSLAASALVPTYGAPLTLATATFDNFVEVLWRQQVTLRAFRNSFLLAGGGALLLAVAAIPLAWAMQRRRRRTRTVLEALIEIPYALPGIVLAIACILLFLKPLPLVGVSLYATPWIILFAYLARFLPLALKPAIAAMAQLDRSHDEAAMLDGAGLLQRLRYVVAPSLAPAAAAGGLLVFLLAFNELTVSALLWSSGTETIGVVLFSLEEAGLASQAAAIGLTTTAVIATVMLGLDRLAHRLPSGILPWRT